VTGSLELGRRLSEICMGGLGHVALTTETGNADWPLGVMVHSNNPVLACLGSQYAGWTIKDDETGFFALGSGPARAMARVEDLFHEIAHTDKGTRAVLVIEGDQEPPAAVSATVGEHCKLDASEVIILYAPTWSLAGTVQIAARVLEVALHKAHELKFPLEHIVDGFGAAPIAPPIPDFVKSMGRTNDGIIYGGRVQLFVRGDDAAAEKLAGDLPSSNSPAYGKPFAEIFAEVEGDFYKIDPMLFSPAVVMVTNLDTGSTFRGGKLAPEIVGKSFTTG
jgi:methenyltetrahydromethanopterin cyclohydrolase